MIDFILVYKICNASINDVAFWFWKYVFKVILFTDDDVLLTTTWNHLSTTAHWNVKGEVIVIFFVYTFEYADNGDWDVGYWYMDIVQFCDAVKFAVIEFNFDDSILPIKIPLFACSCWDILLNLLISVILGFLFYILNIIQIKISQYINIQILKNHETA